MCAHIPCSFTFPSSYVQSEIYVSWIREGLYRRPIICSAVVTTDPPVTVKKQNQGRFHLLGDPRKHNCSLSIRDAQVTDTGKYYFHFRGFHIYGFTDKLNVNVTGRMLLSWGVPHVWGKAVWEMSWPWRPCISELSSIPGYQHHGTNLTCQVTFPRGHLSTERTIQLNVSREGLREG
ncbi:sialic acid-binding Ig-like lectin 14 [Macrotis lagotis]|uniref:sialic acid-binding Ig-like lectin 14 n=1 Tax=Macrotis lagotis TaxID=92651 RepID=UPI003D68B0A2